MMSSLERDLFLILDYDPAVTDIREQYPLELRETLLIAAEAGIRHPEANGWPNVMTSDFYYSKDGVWHAVAVKPSSELFSARVAEKLKIEQLYWEKKQVSWSIMTEKEINRTRARNILWITGGRSFAHPRNGDCSPSGERHGDSDVQTPGAGRTNHTGS